MSNAALVATDEGRCGVWSPRFWILVAAFSDQAGNAGGGDPGPHVSVPALDQAGEDDAELSDGTSKHCFVLLYKRCGRIGQEIA